MVQAMNPEIWALLDARVTLFLAQPLPVSGAEALNIFQIIFGQNPDNYRSAQLPLLPSQASGKIASFNAACVTAPNRIDFQYSPLQTALPKQNPAGSKLNAIGAIDQVLNSIRAVAGKLADPALPNHYLGYGVHFQLAVIDPAFESSQYEGANNIITRHIPTQYRPNLASERSFSLQINERHESAALAKMTVNSIRRWSVDEFQILTFSLTPNGLGGVPQMPMPVSGPPQQFIAPKISFEENNMPLDGSTQYEAGEIAECLKAALSDFENYLGAVDINIARG